MNEYYLMKSGNVITVNRTVNGKTMFDKVGEISSDRESLVIEREQWATVAENWLQSGIDTGVIEPVVKTIGGNWMRESDYNDTNVTRAENFTENTFEQLQRKTRRKRDTLNAY